MLKVLRHKKTQRYIYIGIAVTVVCGFGVSGVLVSRDDKKTMSSLATLNGRKISANEYLKNYHAVQRQVDWMYGDKAAEMRSRINFKGEAWDRLLLLDHAKKENIRASDTDVVKWVTSQPAFKNKGQFDQKYYEMYIQRGLRTDPRDFEEEVRDMLTIVKVQEKLDKDAPLTDDKLKELYIQERSEKNLLYSILPSENFKDQVTVTDKDTEQLYDIVKDQLTAPEKVKISYVTIPNDKTGSLPAEGGSVSGGKEALEDNTTPFADLVKKYNLSPKETPSFSKNESVPEISSLPEVLSKAFSLPAGKDSDWIHHAQGSTKIHIVDKQSEHTMSREEAKDELKKIFIKQKGAELAVKKLKEIKEKLKNGDFETVLKAEKLEVTPLEKYRKGMYPAGIYPSDALEKAVAALKEGEISDAFEIPKGAMIVKVTKAIGLDEKKFGEEKEAFKKETASKRSNDAMTGLLEKLRKNLQMNLELMKELFPSD